MWAKKLKNHDGLSASKKSSFRVKFSLLIAEFSGDLCKQDCSLNGIAFIQIPPTFLMLSEFTPCPNPPQSTSKLRNTPGPEPGLIILVQALYPRQSPRSLARASKHEPTGTHVLTSNDHQLLAHHVAGGNSPARLTIYIYIYIRCDHIRVGGR